MFSSLILKSMTSGERESVPTLSRFDCSFYHTERKERVYEF